MLPDLEEARDAGSENQIGTPSFSFFLSYSRGPRNDVQRYVERVHEFQVKCQGQGQRLGRTTGHLPTLPVAEGVGLAGADDANRIGMALSSVICHTLQTPA